MSIKTKIVNDFIVKKVQLPVNNPEDIKGYELIPELYSNIYICAKKGQGKTTVLFNIIKNCIDKNTIVIFFVSTINRDATYDKIKEWLDKKEIYHEDHMSLYGETKKEDLLDRIITERLKLIEQKKEEVSEEEKRKNNDMYKVINYQDDDDEIKIRIRKPKKKSPEIIFIIDDLSSEIRNSISLRKLLKMNRHIKSKVIVSSQFVSDLYPDSRMQINNWLLFPGHSLNKLKEIYDSSDPSISLDEFIEIYKYATKDKYNFLMIDTSNGEYRKNFNEQIIFNDIIN